MDSRADLVSAFLNVLCCTEMEAEFFLESSEWNVGKSFNRFIPAHTVRVLITWLSPGTAISLCLDSSSGQVAGLDGFSLDDAGRTKRQRSDSISEEPGDDFGVWKYARRQVSFSLHEVNSARTADPECGP